MTFAAMPGLLTALGNGFGESALWQPRDPVAEGRGVTGPVMVLLGRFRIDPQDVPTGGMGEGLNVTQTWFYIDRAQVTGDRKPASGDPITIRRVTWEIVQIDADDIGELALRLIRARDT